MADRIGTLGILAGGGALPRSLIAAATAQGRDVFVIAFNGQTDSETTEHVPHLWCRLGASRKLFKALRHNQVTELVMAGAIRRPGWFELRPDLFGIGLLARLRRLGPIGDDGLLRNLGKIFEAEGIRMIGAHEVATDLLANAGPIGSHQPDSTQLQSIARGRAILQAMGPFDLGQAIVVQDDIVLGIEAVEGTDGLIRRTALLARKKAGKPILVKIAKPQQDMRFDVPTIGQQTLREVAAAGFAGIAVEAGRTILLDADILPNLADELGIFLIAQAGNA